MRGADFQCRGVLIHLAFFLIELESVCKDKFYVCGESCRRVVLLAFDTFLECKVGWQ